MMHMTVTREHVWTAFRRTPDVRLQERYHRILLLMDGKSWPAMAQWLSRDEETIRSGVRAFNEGGAPWGIWRPEDPSRGERRGDGSAVGPHEAARVGREDRQTWLVGERMETRVPFPHQRLPWQLPRRSLE